MALMIQDDHFARCSFSINKTYTIPEAAGHCVLLPRFLDNYAVT